VTSLHPICTALRTVIGRRCSRRIKGGAVEARLTQRAKALPTQTLAIDAADVTAEVHDAAGRLRCHGNAATDDVTRGAGGFDVAVSTETLVLVTGRSTTASVGTRLCTADNGQR